MIAAVAVASIYSYETMSSTDPFDESDVPPAEVPSVDMTMLPASSVSPRHKIKEDSRLKALKKAGHTGFRKAHPDYSHRRPIELGGADAPTGAEQPVETTHTSEEETIRQKHGHKHHRKARHGGATENRDCDVFLATIKLGKTESDSFLSRTKGEYNTEEQLAHFKEEGYNDRLAQYLTSNHCGYQPPDPTEGGTGGIPAALA